MNRGSSISCHDEIISNEDLAEEAGKDVEQIQHAADSCVNLRPIVDPVVCHSMPLRCMGVPIDKASTVEIVGEAKTVLEVATFVSLARAVYHQMGKCRSSREILSLVPIDITFQLLANPR
jgi:hypothetical protein